MVFRETTLASPGLFGTKPGAEATGGGATTALTGRLWAAASLVISPGIGVYAGTQEGNVAQDGR